MHKGTMLCLLVLMESCHAHRYLHTSDLFNDATAVAARAIHEWEYTELRLPRLAVLFFLCDNGVTLRRFIHTFLSAFVSSCASVQCQVVFFSSCPFLSWVAPTVLTAPFFTTEHGIEFNNWHIGESAVGVFFHLFSI